MFKKKSPLHIRFLPSSIAFDGEERTVILSGGSMFELQLHSTGDQASLALVSSEGEVRELASGSPASMAKAFSDAQLAFSEYRETLGWSSFVQKTGVGLVALVIGVFIAAAGVDYYNNRDNVPSSQDTSKIVDQILSRMGDVDTGTASNPPFKLPAPMDARTAPVVSAPSSDGDVIEPSFKIPDVLPEIIIPEEAPEPSVDTQAPEGEASGFDLPAYSPDLWSGNASPEETASTEPTVAPTPQGEDDVEADGNDVSSQSSFETTKHPELLEDADVAASDVEDRNVELEADASDEVALPSDNENLTPIDMNIAKEQAGEALTGLLEEGMTTDEAYALYQTLEEIGRSGEEITPEMLSSLPHEVARMLLDQGLAGSNAPDGTPHRIIRLPSDVLNDYRGEDGVPSIPEANTWSATGNYVQIPLPGGGDIEKPEDLVEFGLEP